MKLQFSSLSDFHLIQYLQKGEKAAFDEIYKRHSEFLFQYAYKRVGSWDDVSDLVQDLFMKLWVKRDSIIIKGSLISYLTFSLRNIIIDRYHHNIIKNNHSDFIKLENECNSTQQQIDYNDLQKFLNLQISKLPEKMQEIFVLRKIQHLTIDEVADKLNLSKQTIKNQLNTALSRLKLSFEGYFQSLLPLVIYYFVFR